MVPRLLGMRPKGHQSLRNGHQSIMNGHQSVRNVLQRGGEASKGVLRCFKWVNMFQSMDICSQQVSGCFQGDPGVPKGLECV